MRRVHVNVEQQTIRWMGLLGETENGGNFLLSQNHPFVLVRVVGYSWSMGTGCEGFCCFQPKFEPVLG